MSKKIENILPNPEANNSKKLKTENPNVAASVETKEELSSEANSVSNMTVEQARYLGKMEGMALGIITLFQQDQIKKPSEQLTNVELLGIDGSLEAIEAFINLGLSDEKATDVISKYIQGDRNPLYAHILYEDHLRWNDWDNIEEKEYAISEDIKEKLIESKASSGEEVLSVLTSCNDLKASAPEVEENVELIGSNE